MPEQPVSDTRARILDTALELFAAQGYQRTSLRQIAERLGITKAAVLYHYPTKDGILATLVRPMVDDLEAVLDRVSRIEPDARPGAVLEGMLDVFIAHRTALLMLRHDVSMLVRRGDDYQRFFGVAIRAHRIIAGPTASRADRVSAAQAVAALGDPLVLFPEVPADELRDIILSGAGRLLPHRPPHRPPARPGRPAALDPERLARARRMYAAGGHSVAEIAAAVGVSRATLYRHLDRSGTRTSET